MPSGEVSRNSNSVSCNAIPSMVTLRPVSLSKPVTRLRLPVSSVSPKSNVSVPADQQFAERGRIRGTRVQRLPHRREHVVAFDPLRLAVDAADEEDAFLIEIRAPLVARRVGRAFVVVRHAAPARLHGQPSGAALGRREHARHGRLRTAPHPHPAPSGRRSDRSRQKVSDVRPVRIARRFLSAYACCMGSAWFPYRHSGSLRRHPRRLRDVVQDRLGRLAPVADRPDHKARPAHDITRRKDAGQARFMACGNPP